MNAVEKFVEVVLALLVVLALIIGAIWWGVRPWITKDTYTAEVTSPVMLDSLEGKAVKFIRVKPQDAHVMGLDKNGVLKLKITDSRYPVVAWATDSDRADGLKQGQIICMSDVGLRSDFFSMYPTFLSYTEGPCK